MELNSLMYALGLSGFFASRAFLPAFAAALALRYGDSIPFLKGMDFVQEMANAPAWFTHPAVVWGLGALALAELIAERSPELRELMDEGMVYVKTALSAATSFGLLSANDAATVNDVISNAAFFDTFPAAISGGITFFLSSVRRSVVEIITEADDDDTLGIRRIINWFEEAWSTFGVWMLLGVPLLVLAMNGLVFGVLFLIRRRYERKMEAARIECPNCKTRIHCFATACHSCDTVNENPVALGSLGGMLDHRESDIVAQKIRLLELKRSPKSGEKVKGRGVDLVCEEDNEKLFGDPLVTQRYLEAVDNRMPKVLVVTAVLGLVPILGLIAGVIYYRFQLVAPYRRYLPWSKGFVTKWLIRILLLILGAAQIVGLGIFAVPAMAFLNHWMYRSALRSQLLKKGLLPA